MEARKRWGWKVKAASFEAGTEPSTRLLSNKVSLDSENKQPENTECSVGRKVLLWAKPATKAVACHNLPPGSFVPVRGPNDPDLFWAPWFWKRYPRSGMVDTVHLYVWGAQNGVRIRPHSPEVLPANNVFSQVAVLCSQA